MATASTSVIPWKNGYPTSDGKPFDSDWHLDLMSEAARQQTESENERLRREIETLYSQLANHQDNPS